MSIAELFFSSAQTRSSAGSVRYVWGDADKTFSKAAASSENKLFHVFEWSGNGFVIVSADDRVMPILGYSFEGSAPSPDNLPLPMQDWIDNISSQIKYAIDNDVYSDQLLQDPTQVKAGAPVVSLTTASWGQGKPFNDKCPLDGTQRCVTGCVPTATAIVMRYHEWPKKGSGSTEAYYTETNNIYVSSRNLNHTYDWDNMPLKCTTQNSDTETDAVSTLMADVGAAFAVDYGTDATGGSVSVVTLFENFSYDPGMFEASRYYYTDEQWHAMLKEELGSNGPVLYSGFGDDGGHQFVLDGYTDDNYFHVNWGWSGYCDGYFTLSNMVPESGYEFNYYQCACFNVKPKTSDEPEDWITFSSPGIEISETAFVQYYGFFFDKLPFFNQTAVAFSGSFRGAVTDWQGTVKEWITNELIYSKPLNSNHILTYSNVYAEITGNIAAGDRIRFFYKTSDSEEWHLIKSSNEDGCVSEIIISDEKSIAESTSFVYDRQNDVILFHTKEGVNATLYSSDNVDVSHYLVVDGTDIRINTRQIPEDTYKITLKKGNDSKTMTFAVKAY